MQLNDLTERGRFKKNQKNLKYYQKTPIFITDEYSKEGGNCYAYTVIYSGTAIVQHAETKQDTEVHTDQLLR